MHNLMPFNAVQEDHTPIFSWKIDDSVVQNHILVIPLMGTVKKTGLTQLKKTN